MIPGKPAELKAQTHKEPAFIEAAEAPTTATDLG